MSQPQGDGPARAFLPAMSRDALLPFYDVFTRLIGAEACPSSAPWVIENEGREKEIGHGVVSRPFACLEGAC